MITKLDHSVRKIATQESLLKINVFHLSPKKQTITVRSLGCPGSFGTSQIDRNSNHDKFVKIC